MREQPKDSILGIYRCHEALISSVGLDMIFSQILLPGKFLENTSDTLCSTSGITFTSRYKFESKLGSIRLPQESMSDRHWASELLFHVVMILQHSFVSWFGCV